jgi:transposase-like protein
VYLDGIVLKRSWAGEVSNVSVLVAIGVNREGYRRILGICEGAQEDKTRWSNFLHHLKERGIRGVRLFITDACMGLVESLGHETIPEQLVLARSTNQAIWKDFLSKASAGETPVNNYYSL